MPVPSAFGSDARMKRGLEIAEKGVTLIIMLAPDYPDYAIAFIVPDIFIAEVIALYVPRTSAARDQR